MERLTVEDRDILINILDDAISNIGHSLLKKSDAEIEEIEILEEIREKLK